VGGLYFKSQEIRTTLASTAISAGLHWWSTPNKRVGGLEGRRLPTLIYNNTI